MFTTSELTNLCVPFTLAFTKKNVPHRYYVLNIKRSDVARMSSGFYRYNLPSSQDKKSPFLKSCATLSYVKSFQGTTLYDWDWDSKSVDWLGCHLPPPVATQGSKSRQWLSSILRRWRHSEAALASSIPIKAFSHKK